MDEALWAQTVEIATGQGVISAAPEDGTYRSDIAQAAVDALNGEGVDTTGESWTALEVDVTPGGE